MPTEPKAKEQPPPNTAEKRDQIETLKTLYGECMRNWVFFLEYRYKFLQTYLLVVGGAAAGFAWLWQQLPYLAFMPWLIATVASWIFAVIEYRTGHVLHATRRSGESLEPHIWRLTACAHSPSEPPPGRARGWIHWIDGRVRRHIIGEIAKSAVAADVEDDLAKGPGFFTALRPTFSHSARQGAVLQALYGTSVAAFFAIAVGTLIIAIVVPRPVDPSSKPAGRSSVAVPSP